ncbi:hypothetical protein SAMN04488135_101398 [Pollutimonas bauzanensis]|uniref:Type IV pilus biogenesis protein PilP n=2 Tax=Pollutimonas bauzanensis TaxID=658167 RepID=A0A1M5N3Q5_9BURK|nr:hypothetical protein SAMN04488135_101398 [Pollutimonas bauzanensis]
MRRRFLEAAAHVLLALPGPAAPQAAAALADDPAAEQMAVRELMRLDTELALSQAKKALRSEGLAGPGAADGSLHTHDGGLKLVAIYGVGKKLLAEVLVGSQPRVYMRGQALPVGVKADPDAYRLRGISGSCVQLERKGEAHTLCLPPSLWTAE